MKLDRFSYRSKRNTMSYIKVPGNVARNKTDLKHDTISDRKPI